MRERGRKITRLMMERNPFWHSFFISFLHSLYFSYIPWDETKIYSVQEMFLELLRQKITSSTVNTLEPPKICFSSSNFRIVSMTIEAVKMCVDAIVLVPASFLDSLYCSHFRLQQTVLNVSYRGPSQMKKGTPIFLLSGIKRNANILLLFRRQQCISKPCM